MNAQLSKLLRGFVAHQPQSVGNMRVIPLTAPDTAYANVGTVRDVHLDRDTSYESLHLGTDSSHVTIVPNGLTYLTKERAQDRTVPACHLINKPTKVSAFCVQSSQCGHMTKGQKESRQLRLLPQSLRYKAWNKRSSTSYSELWASLGEYNRGSSVGGDFLTSYFDKFAGQLEQFVAEFEIIPGQRGAIILINDKVVGLEIAPNTEAFEAIWEPSIRDCYGSEALRARDSSKPGKAGLLGEVESLEDLADAVSKLSQREKEQAQKVVASILDQTVKMRETQKLEELKLYELDTTAFVGSGVTTLDEDDGFIFVSLMAKPMAHQDFRFK